MIHLAETARAAGNPKLAEERFIHALGLLNRDEARAESYRRPAVRALIMEGIADASHAMGDLENAVAAMSQAIDTRVGITALTGDHPREVDAITHCSRLFVLWRKEAGLAVPQHEGFFARLIDRPRNPVSRIHDLALRPFTMPDLQDVAMLAEDHPHAAVDECRRLLTGERARDGLIALNVDAILRLEQRIHRVVGQHAAADRCAVMLHLTELLRRAPYDSRP